MNLLKISISDNMQIRKVKKKTKRKVRRTMDILGNIEENIEEFQTRGTFQMFQNHFSSVDIGAPTIVG